MKNNLVEEISECLHHDEVDFVEVASRLGVNALPSIKKIIDTNNSLAPKAIVLEKVIRMYFEDQSHKKKEPIRLSKFSPAMKKITTTHPDDHLKGFGSDMMRGMK